MRKVLYDTKEIDEITLGQLIDKVDAFAPRQAKILAAKAAMDERIADFKSREEAKFDKVYGTLVTDTAAEESDIAKIIMAHKDWFKKPRSKKTLLAEFGLRKNPDSVKITDNEKVIAYSDENGLKLYADEPVISKDAVMKLLKENEDIPGAKLQHGEKAFIKIIMQNLETELNSNK